MSIRGRTTATAAISALALLAATPSLTQEIPTQVQARIDAMQAQIDAQQAQLDALKAEVASQFKTDTPPARVAAAPVPAPAPVTPVAASVTIKGGTATLASTDAAFSVAVRGNFQIDAATYSQDKDLASAVVGRDLSSGTNIRRARIGLNGRFYTDFDYNILLEFGGVGAEDVGRIHEAWLQYNGFKSVKLRLGEFAPNSGLADAGTVYGSPFMERPAVAEFARTMAGGDTRMALSAFNAHDRWLWYVALTGNSVSSLNTQATAFNAPNNDEQLGMTLRIAGTPLRGKNWLVHTGLSRSAIINPADAGPTAAVRYPFQIRERPELRVDATRLIDTGAINTQSASVTAVELGWQSGPVFVQAEAFRFEVERLAPAAGVSDPEFSGAYIEGGWSLTGEPRKYNTTTAAFDGVTPKANFNPATGDWGAFEVVARYSTLDLNHHADASLAADRVRGGVQDITALGLNWQLNPGMRFVFQGQSVKIERMNSSGVQIGQDYTSIAVRSQFNF